MITILPPQPMAIEYVVSTPFSKKPDYTNCVDFLKEQIASAAFSSVKNQICLLSCMEDDWDGYGAVKLSDEVVRNTYKFVDAAKRLGYCPLSSDDVYATPYGTVVLEYKSDAGLVSIEIGKTQVGFFTDFVCETERNHHSNGMMTSFRTVPGRLRENLAKL